MIHAYDDEDNAPMTGDVPLPYRIRTWEEMVREWEGKRMSEMKIGRWVEKKGDFVTPGGTPYYICEKCGQDGHLHGCEYPRRKVFCEN